MEAYLGVVAHAPNSAVVAVVGANAARVCADLFGTEGFAHGNPQNSSFKESGAGREWPQFARVVAADGRSVICLPDLDRGDAREDAASLYFALAAADVVVFALWFADVGRYHATHTETFRRVAPRLRPGRDGRQFFLLVQDSPPGPARFAAGPADCGPGNVGGREITTFALPHAGYRPAEYAAAIAAVRARLPGAGRQTPRGILQAFQEAAALFPSAGDSGEAAAAEALAAEGTICPWLGAAVDRGAIPFAVAASLLRRQVALAAAVARQGVANGRQALATHESAEAADLAAEALAFFARCLAQTRPAARGGLFAALGLDDEARAVRAEIEEAASPA